MLKILFSQFRHYCASSICEIAIDRVGEIKIDKSSGPIELLLQPKSRKIQKEMNEKEKRRKNQPAKLKT